MIQQNFDIKTTSFYKDSDGNRRKYGIYAPPIDRFLHVSDQDLWMTLQTAALLSSKIQTSVYVLPSHTEITNENCLYWGLYEKNNAVLSSKQGPSVKLLHPSNRLIPYEDFPKDFTEDPTLLNKLKKYVDYIYPRVCAINLSLVYADMHESNTPILQSLDNEWINKFPDYYKSPVGRDFKNILYTKNSPKEAEDAINAYWQEFAVTKAPTGSWDMVRHYYTILGEPIPSNLTHLFPYIKTTGFEDRLSEYQQMKNKEHHAQPK